MAKIGFDVDAYTARLIGRENVSRLESAILELVKNTYDADATCCILYYEAETETLYIADNGSGMSTDVIKKHWMTIGNSSKKRNYVSRKGRVQTGAKGIGRFALDRIGDNCIMLTKSTTENLEWSVDWSLFKDGTPLTNVSADLIDVEYSFDEFVGSAISDNFKKLVKEKLENTGTIFKISPVRDEWNAKMIGKLKNNLSTLVPQEISSIFSIYFFEVNTAIEDAQLIMPDSNGVYDYKISFDVKGDRVKLSIIRNEFDFKTSFDTIVEGAGFSEKDKKYFIGIPIEDEFSFADFMSSKKITIFNNIGDFSGMFLFAKIQYQEEDKQKYYYKNDKQVSLPWKGIRIYRDNFRVRPYGDHDTSAYDWLLLANRKAKSPAAPSHQDGKWRVNADQICGTILISRTNITLPDQANREGFVETPEFAILKSFLTRIIQKFEEDRQDVFRKLSKYYDATHPIAQFEKEIHDKAQNKGGEHAVADYENSSALSMSAESTHVEASKAHAVIKHKDAQIQSLENELQLLRALGTIGILTNTYVHEIRGNTNNLGLKIVMAKEALEYDEDIPEALRNISEAIAYQESFGSWFKVTIETVRKNRRTMKNVNLRDLMIELKNSWNDTCKDIIIDLDCESVEFRCFTYEIESIINNLIANSTTAFKSSGQKNKIISISISADEEGIVISYRDNGPGLSDKYKSNPDKIMEAMETDKTNLDGELIGTGMGMWIIGKTVVEYNGNVDLSENVRSESGFYAKIALKGRRISSND